MLGVFIWTFGDVVSAVMLAILLLVLLACAVIYALACGLDAWKAWRRRL